MDEEAVDSQQNGVQGYTDEPAQHRNGNGTQQDDVRFRNQIDGSGVLPMTAARTNSLQNAEIRQLLFHGFALAVCGAVSIVVATIASSLEAEKTYHLESYTNTHWITTVFLFAGLSVILLEKFKLNFFLYLAIALCIVSWPVAIGAFVADVMNIVVVVGVEWNTDIVAHWAYLSKQQLITMVIYAMVDMIVCAAAAIWSALVLLELRNVSSRYFAPVEDFKNMLMLCCGISLTTLSVVRLILWMIELVWLRNLGSGSKFLFLHYTIDEPSWNCIFIVTGVLTTIVALRGTRLLMYVSLGITALSAGPVLLYFWVDYRWLSQVKMAEMTVHVPKPPGVLMTNLFVGGLHMLVILITVIVEIRYLSLTGSYIYQVALDCDKALKQAINYGGILVMLSGMSFLVSDLVNLMNRSFYRVFYPTEQKLPFLLCAAGILTFFSINRNICLFFIPAAFIALVVSAYTCVFHIAAYIFLAYHTYFQDELCELFFYGRKHCNAQAERMEVWAHFVETLMAAAVMMLCTYIAYILFRVTKLYRVNLGALSLDEMRKKRICEMWITVIGVSSLLCGLTVFSLSTRQDTHFFDNDHPLLIIHSVVYRSCLAQALIIFPIIQIIFARDLLFYPLRSITLSMVALLRFVEIITQLDYRNIGQDTGPAWTVFSLVELASLAAHFATLCFATTLIDVGINRPSQFDFVQHDATADDADRYAPRFGRPFMRQMVMGDAQWPWTPTSQVPEYRDEVDESGSNGNPPVVADGAVGVSVQSDLNLVDVDDKRNLVGGAHA